MCCCCWLLNSGSTLHVFKIVFCFGLFHFAHLLCRLKQAKRDVTDWVLVFDFGQYKRALSMCCTCMVYLNITSTGTFMIRLFCPIAVRLTQMKYLFGYCR